jgi:Fic family protein
MPTFIWRQESWTERFRWDSRALLSSLGEARRRQGELLGRVSQLGFELNAQLHGVALTEEALTTAAIEGDVLDRAQVRSSVARRLGLSTAGLPQVDRRTYALAEVLLDATQNHAQPQEEIRVPNRRRSFASSAGRPAKNKAGE